MSFLREETCLKGRFCPLSCSKCSFLKQDFFFNLHFSLEFEINIDCPIQLCFWAPTAKASPCLWQALCLFIFRLFFFFSKVHLPSSLPSKTLKTSRCEYKNDSTRNPAHPFGNPTSNQNIQLMGRIIQFFSVAWHPGSPAFTPLHPL